MRHVAARAPQREHGAVVHALGATCGNRDHIARASGGEHVGDGQHAHIDALDTGGRDMGDELQVVRLGLDRDQAVAGTHLAAAFVLVQHQGGRLDLAAGDMGDGAGGDLGQLIAEYAAAVVGGVVGPPQVAAAGGDVAVGGQVLGRLGLGVAYGRADHGPALAQLGVGQAHVDRTAAGDAQAFFFQAGHVG